MKPRFELASDDNLFRPDSGIGLSDYSSDSQLQSEEIKKERKNPLNNFEDPLDEPMVRYCLQKIQLTRCQLINMSVKELNRRLLNCSPIMVTMLKRCRRTLKNRGYAKNCRIKRIATKNRLEEINTILLRENKELKDRNKFLLDQIRDLTSNQIGEFSPEMKSPIKYDTGQQQQQQQSHEQHLNVGQNNVNYGIQTFSDDQDDFSTNRNASQQANYLCKAAVINASNAGSYSSHYDDELDYLMETITPDTNSLGNNNWPLATLSM